MPKVTFEKRGRIALITLNRPEAKNAIDQTVHALLIESFARLRDDKALDVAIVTGAGDAFCAGMDLKKFVPTFVGASPQQIADWVKLGLGGITRGLHRIDKPIIAAVNGWSLAGGFELALAADIRIASERAKFGSFEARRGFHHGDGGIARLVNSCGASVAMEMLLTAEPVDAQRAMQLGIVSRVVPHARLLAEAELIARQILRNDQPSVRSAKATILDMIGRTLDDQLRTEAINAYTLMASGKDVTPRLKRFYKKRDRGRAGTHATPL